MKLSEAIQEGSKLRPQAFNAYFDKQNGVLCSCALGAAYEAALLQTAQEKDLFDADLSRLSKLFPELYQNVDYPLEEEITMLLCDAITELNDEAKWSRTRIADWLAEQGY